MVVTASLPKVSTSLMLMDEAYRKAKRPGDRRFIENDRLADAVDEDLAASATVLTTSV